mgnify:CR=1 FL=1
MIGYFRKFNSNGLRALPPSRSPPSLLSAARRALARTLRLRHLQNVYTPSLTTPCAYTLYPWASHRIPDANTLVETSSWPPDQLPPRS